MQGLYGSKWVDMWRSGKLNEEGKDVGTINAVQTWGRALSTLREDQVMYGLSHVETACKFPPTLPEFIGFCRSAPAPQKLALPPPDPTPEQRKERAVQAEKLKKINFAAPGLGWAYKLKELYQSGTHLPDVSIKYASEVLGESWSKRQCVKRND